MSISDSSGSIGSISRNEAPSNSKLDKEYVSKELKDDNQQPVMVSKKNKKEFSSKRAAFAKSKNSSQTKPHLSMPRIHGEKTSDRHNSRNATTARSRSSSSSNSEWHEERMISLSAPTFSSASSTTNATSTSSTPVFNPEWAQFHQQALDLGGGFLINRETIKNIDTFCSWLASSPAGVTTIGISQYTLDDPDFVKLCTALKYNQTLTALDFFCTNISVPNLARALEVNQGIESLSIIGSNIDKEGAEALAAALKVNRVINCLTLNLCAFGSEGAKVLAAVLKDNPNITDINFVDNDIGDEGAVALAKALEGNNTIRTFLLGYIQYPGLALNAFIKAMSINTTLTQLRITLDSPIIERELEINRQLPRKIMEAKAALELINTVPGKNDKSVSLMYPREVMDQIVDQMVQAGLKDGVIDLGKIIMPKI